MVKADVRRDYYADLGVSPSADTDEIKKQFRKLALKYHPDRNPGREAEFNAKFQAIQAAHEILSDPQQRLKYDTERLRAGYGKLYGPPQNNSPRRTNSTSYPSAASGKTPTAKAAFPQRSSYQAPPSTGAQRYASYAKAAPQQPWEKVYEAQTRADAFRGFQEMKSGANSSGWSKFDPRTGKPTQQQQQAGKSTPTAMPAGNASRMKSAYEHVNSKQASTGSSRSQSTKKKQGFAPGNPDGDEPMARNVSSYSSTPRADRTSAFFDSVPSKKSPVESSRPVSPQEDYAIPEFERTSTRYATTGGEKTYFSSAGLGRSTSMRDSSGSSRTRPRTNPPSPTSPLSGRHHSASPKLKTHRDRTFSSSTSSSDLDEDERPQSKPKAIPKSRLRPNQKISDFYSPKDWNPGFGEDSSGRMNAPQFRDYFRSWNGFGSFRPHSYHDYVDRNYTDNECHKGFTYRSEHPFPTAEAAKYEFQEKSAGDNGEKKSFNLYGPTPQSDTPVSRHEWRHSTPRAVSGDMHHNTGSDPSSLGVKSVATLPITKRLKVCHDVECAVPDSEEILASMNRIYVPALSRTSTTSGDLKADSVNSHSFGEPATGKTFVNGGPKSKSHEHLNKRFSASEWNGVFQGGDFFSPTTSSNSQRNGPSTSPTREQSTTRQDSASQPNAASSSEDFSREQKPMPFAPGKFSADAWVKQLQNNTWAVPHPEIGKQQTNPRTTRSPRKQSRSTPKPATRPQQATVSSETEEDEATIPERNNRGFAEATAGAPEAMEIDEEPPNKAEAPRVDGAAEPATARAESNKSTSQPNGANKMGSGAATGNGGKANGAKNDLFNLKNLNDVAPFTSTNSAGIDDLKDIQANLPFESRPNNPNVGRRVVRPRELNFPNPPKRPRRPAVVPAGNDPRQMVLPQKAWDRYVAEMSAYMREWNEFNRLMLRHFNARQEAVETGLSPRWISAVGDSTRLNVNAEDGARDAEASEVDDTDDNLVPGQPTGGFNAYLRGIEEDFKVRQHWEVSWERHRACILELGELRDWIRNGGKVVA